jgi:hypothetical protein
MADFSQLEDAFRAVLWELREYLDDLVVIGGWIPHLYRKYGGFSDWTLEAALTAEVDLLITRPLSRSPGGSIPEVLRAAGFEPESDPGASAIWSKDPASGEKVEFLIAHQGTARRQGQVVSVAGQENLGAISLAGLDLLGRHTSVLQVPLGVFEQELVTADVRVPRLGAYVVNKAVTFPYRARTGEVVNPKRAKDLLYLRDLMAAGDQVVERIEQDVLEIANSDATAVNDISGARNNLGLVLRGALRRVLPEATRALTVRFGMQPDAAMADLSGHLTDLEEILGHALR